MDALALLESMMLIRAFEEALMRRPDQVPTPVVGRGSGGRRHVRRVDAGRRCFRADARSDRRWRAASSQGR
jgi:hypothetical protein